MMPNRYWNRDRNGRIANHVFWLEMVQRLGSPMLSLYYPPCNKANLTNGFSLSQVLSSFMLSVSAVVMSYLQNPAPMTPPWAG